MTTPTGLLMAVEVNAPGFERYAYGLLSAASVVPVADDRWEMHGVIYQSDACLGESRLWNPECPIARSPITAFTVGLTKAAGADVVVATLESRDAAYNGVAVVVTIGATTNNLANVGTTANFNVVASTPVDASATIAAGVGLPTCTSPTQTLQIPATAVALPRVSLTCQVTPAAPAPQGDKVFETGPVNVEGEPFLIYDGVRCPGMSAAEARERVQRRMAAHEQVFVEARVHETVLRRNTTQLGTAAPLVRAIGLLEDYIAEEYGGVGVIHVPRQFAALMAKQQLLRRDGARMRSPMDNFVAFGAGYPNTDPAGAAAAATFGWLYATGPVVVRRGDVQVRDAFDQRFNTRLAVAERSYVVTADCPRAVVQFTDPEA